MEMLLMGVCLSVLGLAVACMAFGAATRDADERTAAPGVEQERVESEVVKPAIAARFFVEPAQVLPLAARHSIPIEALLLQIESHVRQEQAAAECFLEAPNATLLHSRTGSPFVN